LFFTPDGILSLGWDDKTGELANEGKSFSAATAMCLVFV
jgi:hypothetical protein